MMRDGCTAVIPDACRVWHMCGRNMAHLLIVLRLQRCNALGRKTQLSCPPPGPRKRGRPAINHHGRPPSRPSRRRVRAANDFAEARKIAHMRACFILAQRQWRSISGDPDSGAFAHREGRGSAFVKTHAVTRLVWYEEFPLYAEAIQRETSLKRWKREWKLTLIEETNPDWNDRRELEHVCDQSRCWMAGSVAGHGELEVIRLLTKAPMQPTPPRPVSRLPARCRSSRAELRDSPTPGPGPRCCRCCAGIRGARYRSTGIPAWSSIPSAGGAPSS